MKSSWKVVAPAAVRRQFLTRPRALPQAGDNRAIEASGVLKTNDPAGFNIVDVFAWGAIGHAIGFSAVASQGFFN